MATGYFARGDLKRIGGDPDGAIADLTIAIQLNPTFPGHTSLAEMRTGTRAKQTLL